MREKEFILDEFCEKIKLGDRASLAQAITLVESTKESHKKNAADIINKLISTTGNSIRIGITGVPGVGKSTFIETFGGYLTAIGKKVAVLAIDPTSAISGGSILGDKTLMEKLAVNPNAFIRPSATAGTLGGIARNTYEAMLLCEAAGYDVILIETVGVGQSETLVYDTSDFFLYLQVVGTGSDLQAIKRGIMEMADLIFINKITKENLNKAKKMQIELKQSLHLFSAKEYNLEVPVLMGSALNNEGIQEVWTAINTFEKASKNTKFWYNNRQNQVKKRFEKHLTDLVIAKYTNNHNIKASERVFDAMLNNEISSFSVAQQLLDEML